MWLTERSDPPVDVGKPETHPVLPGTGTPRRAMSLSCDTGPYWTNACQACALKGKCTTGKERRISRWEHEAVLEADNQRAGRKRGDGEARERRRAHACQTGAGIDDLPGQACARRSCQIARRDRPRKRRPAGIRRNTGRLYGGAISCRRRFSTDTILSASGNRRKRFGRRSKDLFWRRRQFSGRARASPLQNCPRPAAR
jgi:hypothetical protein